MKKKIKSDEIDLIEVMLNIWDNKLKIAAITFIFISISIIISYFIYNPLLKAKTSILPISIFETNLYAQYNSYIENLVNEESKENYEIKNLDQSQILIKKINPNYLLSLFVEELKKKNLIIDVIQNYQLVDQKKYDGEDEYLKAVENKASNLVLINQNINGNKKDENKSNWIIEFNVDDSSKWEDALSYIDNQVNKNVKNHLKSIFNLNLENLKLLNQFKLEDLNTKIINAKKNYEIETSNRLFFLKEQALIARELNIRYPSIDIETFNTPSGVISNVQMNTPYYMKGYLPIEKEIELIKARTNKDAFTQILLKLENQKIILLENKSLERFEKLFTLTPIINGNNFRAAKIVYKDTKYESSFSLIKMILFGGIFGIIFGMFYVLISNAIYQRK
jgi:LPS O-antigen subunit length determinant protein (WzzB/FepE family)